MRTGEGKTLTATLAVALNALDGRGVHVVTVNDYLAKRDTQWMGQVYDALGLSVACIQHDAAFIYDPDWVSEDERLARLRPISRREAYEADITYGTNNEFGFDYLRDNMVPTADRMVQRDLVYAIVDEVDNILIDEARTPLIISGQAEQATDRYYQFAQIVKQLREGKDYEVDHKHKSVALTEDGIDRVEQLLELQPGREHLRRALHRADALPGAGAQGARHVPAGQGLHRPRRRGDHRRRVHRPHDDRSPLLRGAASGDRGQGRACASAART